MHQPPKYGLRNARELLDKIRKNHRRGGNIAEDANEHNETFADEEKLSVCQDKIKTQEIEEKKVQQYQPIKQIEVQQTTFCDRIIIKHLNEILELYSSDLQILQQNRENLYKNIEVLVQRISKLPEVELENNKLIETNKSYRQKLQHTIEEYHTVYFSYFQLKLQQQSYFNSLRSKLRLLINKYEGDLNLMAFIEEWNQYVYTSQAFSHKIEAKVQAELKEKAAKDKKIKLETAPLRRNEETIIQVDPKPKKRISENEKALLLGDLKSFAKNFKLPRD